MNEQNAKGKVVKKQSYEVDKIHKKVFKNIF